MTQRARNVPSFADVSLYIKMIFATQISEATVVLTIGVRVVSQTCVNILTMQCYGFPKGLEVRFHR